MEILIVTTTKFENDGITNVIMNNYRNIDKKKFKFDFVLPNIPSKKLFGEMESNNSKVYVIKDRLNNTLRYVIQLNKVLRNKKYDIIHVHGNSNTLAIELNVAKLNGVPVRIAHAHSTSTRFPLVHQILTMPFKKAYTHGIACGEQVGTWLYNKDSYLVIENGIEVEKYKYDRRIREEKRKELGFTSELKVIGNVGYFSEVKNHRFLIGLFKKLYEHNPKYRLVLVGDGHLRAEIENEVEKLKLDQVVKFLGKRSDVNALMSAFDILIMPSLYEGVPLTLLEAQSADLKTFVSDTVSGEVNITKTVSFNLTDELTNLIGNIDEYFKNGSKRNLHISHKIMKGSKYNVENSIQKMEETYIKYYKENIINS